MSTWVNNQSGTMQQTAQLVSGGITSGGITYGVVASGAVVSGSMCISGMVQGKNVDPNIIGANGNEYWRFVGSGSPNSHLMNCAGYSSGVGTRWYIAGLLNRHGGTDEAGVSSWAQVQQYCYAIPYLAGRGGDVVEIAAQIVAPSTVSGAQFQLGIYETMSGGDCMWPGDRIWSSSTILCSLSGGIASGTVYALTPSPTVTLAPNKLYWLAIAGHPVTLGPTAVRQVQQGLYSPWGHNYVFDQGITTNIKEVYVNDSFRFSGNWPLQNPFPPVSGQFAYNNVGIFAIGLRF